MKLRIALTASLIGLAGSVALAAGMPTNMIHVRGTLARVSHGSITVSTLTGSVKMALPRPAAVMEVVPANRSEITSGRLVGITSITAPNGAQRAVEVHIMPASQRGGREGSWPWDYPGAPHSKMTNGLVSSVPMAHMTNGMVTGKPRGESVSVTYTGASGSGSQKIIIPPGIPVVTFRPGKLSDLQEGDKVFVMATRGPAGLTASRIMIGEDGARPPM